MKDASDALIDNLKDAARYLFQNGKTQQGLAVQACVTMLEDDSDDTPTDAAAWPMPEPWPEGACFVDDKGQFYDEQARPLGVQEAAMKTERELVMDLSLLVARMARRLRRDGFTVHDAGDRALADQAVAYLQQHRLTSPLRDGDGVMASEKGRTE